jgi:hypothetical protein
MTNVFFHGYGKWVSGEIDDDRLIVFYDLGIYEFHGVFCLSNNDETIYKYTRNLDHVNWLWQSKHTDDGKIISENLYKEERRWCINKATRRVSPIPIFFRQ